MGLPKVQTPLEKLYHFVNKSPEKPLFHQPLKKQWHQMSWRQVEEKVRLLAASLKAKNYPEGSKIAIFSKNCADWIISDLAIWMAGYVSVPLYPTFSADTIHYILKHSEAKLLIAGKLDKWEEAKPGIPSELPVICFDHWPLPQIPSLSEFCQGSLPMKESPIPSQDQMATIIYTSGTSGTPKGVVHHFSQIAFVGSQIVEILKLSQEDRFFSYLPLSHVAERLVVELGGLYSGAEIYFAESLEQFKVNMNHASPTIFLGVPRIWAKFQDGIYKNLPPKKLNLLLKIPFLSKMIKNKISNGLGLNKTRIALTGAAHMAPSLFDFFDSIDIPIKEAYGMTENFAYSHITLEERKPHYVGKSHAYANVKIGDNDEILIASPATMVGYYKEPEKTKQVLEGEFLKTGDCGEIDSDNYLKITGRAKDLFKTAKGKYITPAPIEMKLEKSSLIEQSCVTGSMLSQPICLVCTSDLAKELSSDELEKELNQHLKEVNSIIDSWERMSCLVIVKDQWSVENELLTPTMKMKRNKVEEKYQNQMVSWEEQKKKVIFE